MLAQALRVVEAARVLKPYPGRIGIYTFACEPRHLPIRIRELSESIQEFDKATGRNVANEADVGALLARVIQYAGDRGIDLTEMLAQVGATGERIEALADQDLKPKPGEMGAPDDMQDVSVGRQAVLAGAAVLGKPMQTAPKYDIVDDFPGSPGLEARLAENSVAADDRPIDPMAEHAPPPPAPPEPEEDDMAPPPDGEGALDEIEDKLKALTAQQGWSPELENATLLLRKARSAMQAEDGPSGVVYRVGPDAIRALVAASLAIAALERGLPEDDMDFAGPTFR